MRFYHTRVKVYGRLTGESFLVGGIHTASEELVADWILGGYLKPKDMLIPSKEELVEELKKVPVGDEYRKFYYCYMMVEDDEAENDKEIERFLQNANFCPKNSKRENFKTEHTSESEPVQLSISDIAKH